MMTTDYPTLDDVLTAQERIRPHVHRTPVLTSTYLNQVSGADLLFKCENFQKAGAFKARGATNAVFSLTDAQAAKGVATHSSGNHGSALCYAASRRGIPATVVMPTTVPLVKRSAVLSYGGTVIECEPTQSSREARLADFVDKNGATFVHPYNDLRVIVGQATCAREFVDDVGELDAVIAPIGGGGLVSGTCLALSESGLKPKIYAAEPQNADDAQRSLKAGHIVTLDAPDTVADGLKLSLKELTWHFVSTQVDDILLVGEQEIIDAMRLAWERMKLVIEPSAAVPIAAILKNKPLFAGKRVGVILSGGNVDLNRLPWQNMP